jgi:Retrotransposon gag protein
MENQPEQNPREIVEVPSEFLSELVKEIKDLKELAKNQKEEFDNEGEKQIWAFKKQDKKLQKLEENKGNFQHDVEKLILKSIKPFSGDPAVEDIGAVDELVFKLEEYQTKTDCSDDKLVTVASLLLTGAANEFYRKLQQSSDNLSWGNLKSFLLNRYLQKDFAYIQTVALVEAKQKGNETISQFAERFQRLANQFWGNSRKTSNRALPKRCVSKNQP